MFKNSENTHKIPLVIHKMLPLYSAQTNLQVFNGIASTSKPMGEAWGIL